MESLRNRKNTGSSYRRTNNERGGVNHEYDGSNNGARGPYNVKRLTLHVLVVVLFVLTTTKLLYPNEMTQIRDSTKKYDHPRSNQIIAAPAEKRFIQTYHDILTSNDSGTDPEDVDYYARNTLTGQFLWNCNGKPPNKEDDYPSSKENDMCNAQFPVLDYSDYIHESFDKSFLRSPAETKMQSPPANALTNEYMVLTRRGYKGGDINEQVNQDRPFILHDQDSNNFIMGVFDGHGELGHSVAHFLLMDLIQYFYKRQQNDKNDARGWIDLFKMMNHKIPPRFSWQSGSTASIIVRSSDELYIANTGDSMSFVVAYEKSKVASAVDASDASLSSSVKIVYKTRRDKAHLPEERKRIESAGGDIQLPQIVFGGTMSSRVHYPIPGGFYYSLAMSRSLGDAFSKDFGVIADPIVDVFQIQELKTRIEVKEINTSLRSSGGVLRQEVDANDVELFLVSLSDGLFDELEIEEMAQYLAFSLERHESGALYKACKDLIVKSSQLWTGVSVGRGTQLYRDDISIAVRKI